jgi:hypothetical protein
MAGDDTFTERFFERFDRITVVKLSKRRCQLKRTFGYFIDRMASCAICPRVGQASLLFWIHLRVCACGKNQTANSECRHTYRYLNFVQKGGAHESDPRLCVFEQRLFFYLLTVEPAKRSSIVQYDAPCTGEFD